MRENQKEADTITIDNALETELPPSFEISFKRVACNPSFSRQRSSIAATIWPKTFLIFSEAFSLSSSIELRQPFEEEVSVAPVSTSRLRKAFSKEGETPSDKQFETPLSENAICFNNGVLKAHKQCITVTSCVFIYEYMKHCQNKSDKVLVLPKQKQEKQCNTDDMFQPKKH